MGTDSEVGRAPLKRLAIYAFYDKDGVVSDYVVYKLQQLRRHVDSLVVVSNGELGAEAMATMESLADTVVCRENSGFDIWAFRAGLVDVVGWNRLKAYDEVILLNSTFFGPLFPFSELFDEMDGRDHDFWGITAFKGPVPNGFTFVGVIPFHIQSYFMAFRRRLFDTRMFRDYWEQLPPLATYVDAVLTHESFFTEFLSNQGFRYSVYCDPKDYKAVNPAFDLLDMLVENRCPILKRRAFFHEPLYLDLNNVELHRAVELIRTRSDYDVSLIWKDITRTAKPDYLHSNATLLEVVQSSGKQAALRPDLKVAVFAHLTEAERADELETRLAALPVAYDLHVTVPSESMREVVARRLTERAHPGMIEVRAVPATAGNALAFFAGQRDAIERTDYDYGCRIQLGPLPRHSFARDRHLRDHSLGNLLESPIHVSNLLAIFERDKSVGILLPTEIHIAHGTGIPVNQPGVHRWAGLLGITVPLDGFAPEVPGGSMFWFRREALRCFLQHEFSAADAGGADGTIQESLERLLVPGVHQSGFYALRVMTPESMAKNYVKLEYKLQRMIGEEAPRPPRDRFPKVAISDYLRTNSPPVFFVVQKSYRATRAVYEALRGVGQKVFGEGRASA